MAIKYVDKNQQQIEALIIVLLAYKIVLSKFCFYRFRISIWHNASRFFNDNYYCEFLVE